MKVDVEAMEKRKKKWEEETRAIYSLMRKADMTYQQAVKERARLYKLDFNKK